MAGSSLPLRVCRGEKLTPLKRPATAEEIADVALFLATGTSLMTGQILIANGGRTI